MILDIVSMIQIINVYQYQDGILMINFINVSHFFIWELVEILIIFQLNLNAMNIVNILNVNKVI